MLSAPRRTSSLQQFLAIHLSLAILGSLFFLSGVMQAQATAALVDPAERIIVKLKPSLASETEAQVTRQSGGRTQIRAGQSGNVRIESFLRRHAAQQITPLYPQMIQLRKQHGWSDAQMADHIRQHFKLRA